MKAAWISAWPAAALAAGSACLPAQAAARYECSMLDGSVRVVGEDLSLRFSSAVRRCEALQARMEPEPPAAQPLTQPRFATDAVGQPMRGAVMMADTSGGRPVSTELERLVHQASRSKGLDPRFVMAVIRAESGYRVTARSPKGALGLMQIMPATGARFGVESPRSLLDPATNIDVGTRYLRWLHDRFEGRLDLVLAGYNAGEGAVERYGNRIPPYPETREYVRKILGSYLPASVSLR